MITRSIRGRILPLMQSNLLSSTIWSAVGEALAKGLFFLAIIITARILAQDEYGEFGLIRTTVMTFATLGGLGIGLTANRYIAESKERNPGFAGELIGSVYLLAGACGGIVAALLFFTAPIVAATWLNHPQLADGLRVAALLVALASINGAQTGVLQGFEAYRNLALGNLLQGVSAVVCMPAGAMLYGLNGVVAGFFVYSFVGLLVLSLAIRKEISRYDVTVSYRVSKDMLPILTRFSLPVALIGIAIAPFKWGSEALLAKSAGFGDLGIFHAAMIIPNILIVGISTLNAPLISAAARSTGEGWGRGIQYLNLYAGWYLFVVVALPVVLFPELQILLLGDSYDVSSFYFSNVLLVLYCGLMLYCQGVIRIVAAHGSMWSTLATNVAEGVALVVAFYFLSDLGAVGLAVSYVISYLVRVAFFVPLVACRGIVHVSLLLDKFFVLSVVIIVGTVAMQAVRYS